MPDAGAPAGLSFHDDASTARATAFEQRQPAPRDGLSNLWRCILGYDGQHQADYV